MTTRNEEHDRDCKSTIVKCKNHYTLTRPADGCCNFVCQECSSHFPLCTHCALKTKTCPACDKPCRKTTTVYLLHPTKGPERKRVCVPCANSGMTVVAPAMAPKVEEKMVRLDGYDKALTQLRVLMRGAQASAKSAVSVNDVHETHRFIGRAEGYEGAIEVIKREMGQ
jgi:hypothetical protein